MLYWSWHVRHARGFRELGMLAAAKRELAKIPPDRAREATVLQELACLAQDESDWKRLVKYASQLAEFYPDEPGGWVLWAYGARRHESLKAAEAILLQALLKHPGDATIHFNLGCYACCLGDMPAALRRVARAIAIDSQFKALAASDPDLEPLRRSGALKT